MFSSRMAIFAGGDGSRASALRYPKLPASASIPNIEAVAGLRDWADFLDATMNEQAVIRATFHKLLSCAFHLGG